ncbi:MAG: hypothetical protein ACUVQG_13075 [Thermogutta sp.]
MRRPAILVPILSAVLAVVGLPAHAWGPHPQITQAALDVLPNIEEVQAKLGKDNVKALTSYCWMPDWRGRDLGTFYADDYLLIPSMPRHIGHTMPAVAAAFEPYFRRALQALRTESPANACRQLGTLVHFVEDVGAPPHAKENCPHHNELENWVKAELITIRGYKARLLGNTDDEALEGLRDRIAKLVAFSKERAERALPLVSSANPDRAQVEPIILESAIESAKVTADVLFTVFTLGLRPNSGPGRSSIQGTITAPGVPGNNDQSPRVILLQTDYATLGEAASGTVADQWQGSFVFHHLPAGTYQLVVYRIGALPKTVPVTLVDGEVVNVAIQLDPTEPVGNLVYNPDGKLRTLIPDLPDRWALTASGKNRVWTSSAIPLNKGQKYRCGIVAKSRGTRVSIVVSEGRGNQTKGKVLGEKIFSDTQSDYELEFIADSSDGSLSIQIETAGDLSDAVDKVWVVNQP